MSSFEITGGKKLKGEFKPQGAKNEVLQILCAVLMTPEKITINNVPDIVDVNKLIDLLRSLNVKVEKLGPEAYSFQADDIDIEYLHSPDFMKKGGGLRGSIMLVGPLLGRFGKEELIRILLVLKNLAQLFIMTLKQVYIAQMLKI